jgi:hypothetical protein
MKTSALRTNAMKTYDRRTAGVPPWALLIQLFLGLGWLRAATEKTLDAHWWSGDTITAFLGDHDSATIGWYRPFVDLVIAENPIAIAMLMAGLQLAAAASLITGRHLGAGLAVGLFLNAHFVAAGAVNPSAFYILGQLAVVLWMVEQRPHDARCRQWLGRGRLLAILVGLASIPFVQTLHPAEVIDDSAVMFVTFSTLFLAVVLRMGRWTAPTAWIAIERVPPPCDNRTHVPRAGAPHSEGRHS